MLLKSILDLILPRFCLICDRRLTQSEEYICLHCNANLPRTYQWEHPTDNGLAKRFYGRLPAEKVASYIYHEPKTDTAKVVYDYKFHHEPTIASYFGTMMAKECGQDFFSGIDGLVPVPITSSRKKKRGGYNQSELLAQGVSKVTGIEVYTDVLVKKRDTASQITTLSHEERAENLEGVFQLHKHASRYHGKHLMIIDDVITSSSTIISCGKCLLDIPDVKLSVLAYSSIR